MVNLIFPVRAHAGLDPRPGSFSGLMDLYERNYMLLRRLLPAMLPADARQVSQAAGALDLHLHVSERFRYTSELSLTYRFEHGDGQVLLEPDLHVRIYHDARLAEVMVARLRHAPPYRLGAAEEASELYARCRANRFLYKWLCYCTRQGHGFASATGAPHNS